MLHGKLFQSLRVVFDNRDTQKVTEPDPDQKFWAELATLSPEERERRLEKRRQYERFAQRLGIVTAEDEAEHLRLRW